MPQRYRNGKFGLYQDDELVVLTGATGREPDQVRKDMVDHFKKLGLRITVDTNLKVVNFLDLTLNLGNG